MIRRLRFAALVIFVAGFSTTQLFALHATSRMRRHNLRRHHGRHVVWNPVFRGSHELLVKENEQLDLLGLTRIADDDELARLEEQEDLVPLNETSALKVSEDLPTNRRYCRPWTRDFVQDLSEAYYKQFRRPIEVTSAVRTMAQQRKLRRRNRNAAPELGDTASTHLTGVTVDILKRGMTRRQHKWLEQYFLPLRQLGLIEPVEERRQPVFHVMVSDDYSDWRDSQKLADSQGDLE